MELDPYGHVRQIWMHEMRTLFKEDKFGEDRINELTDDLLCHILSFMTLKDAARTCILSTRWRYLWTVRSNFCFDVPTLLGITLPECRYFREDRDIMQLERYRFIQRMDRIMKLYRGPKIESFEICFCFSQEFAHHLNQWISFAIKEGAEKLVLKFWVGKYIWDRHTAVGETEIRKSYVFSSRIVPRETQLKHLHLEQCFLRLSCTFDGFHSLRTLQLDIVILKQKDIENLLANTSKLEKLTMVGCFLPSHCKVTTHFMKLKSLRIFRCLRMKKMVLSSPSLVSFEYLGDNISHIDFVNVPCLMEVYVDVYQLEGIAHVFTQLPLDLPPSVETLKIVMDNNKAQSLPMSITLFSSLKCLELIMVQIRQVDLLWIIPVLDAAPLLQKLHFMLKPEDYYNGERKKEINRAYHHQNLQVVEISGFTANWRQIAFAKFVLSYAVALEKLVINPRSRFYAGYDRWFNMSPFVPWTETERTRVLQALQSRSYSFPFFGSRKRNHSDVSIVIM